LPAGLLGKIAGQMETKLGKFMETKERIAKKIGVFLLLVFSISSIFYYEMETTGTAGNIGGFWMWSPAIAAILTKAIFRENLGDIGWRVGERKYLLQGLVIPFLYGLIIYGIVWITGLGRFTPEPFGRLVVYATVGIVLACIAALGEEIGWRGLLVPELYKITSFRNTVIITGFIWAIWHYPAIIFADYNSEAPLFIQLGFITVAVLGFSIFTAWQRIKTGSIWPSVLWHGGHNLFIQQIFLNMTTDTGKTSYYVDDFGIGVFIAGMVLGIIYWRKRAELGARRTSVPAAT
jgi:membrane protease YdiL (CAAX protease family)